jgi:hypothetical protein
MTCVCVCARARFRGTIKEEALSHFCKEELLQGADQLYCDNCKSKCDAIKVSFVSSFVWSTVVCLAYVRVPNQYCGGLAKLSGTVCCLILESESGVANKSLEWNNINKKKFFQVV